MLQYYFLLLVWLTVTKKVSSHGRLTDAVQWSFSQETSNASTALLASCHSTADSVVKQDQGYTDFLLHLQLMYVVYNYEPVVPFQPVQMVNCFIIIVAGFNVRVEC